MTTLSLISSQSALDQLRALNRSIADTQERVATGKKINSAADNAALWRFTQSIQTDVSAYTALGEGLTTAKATVSVASTAADEVVSTLNQIKTKVSESTGAGANTTAIQAEIDALVEQLDTIVSGASLNGVNLLQNRLSSSSENLTVLAGFDGSGAPTNITVAAQDLQTTAASFGAGAVAPGDETNYISATSVLVTQSGSNTFDIVSGGVTYGASYRVTLSGAGSHALSGLSVPNFEYVARRGDTNADVLRALDDQIQDYITANNLSASMTVTPDYAAGQLTIQNLDADPGDTITLTAAVNTGGTAGGALSGVNDIDVTTANGRTLALASIDTLISTATTAAAAIGSGQRRLEIQESFVTSMSATLQNSISEIVDADAEEEAAKLTALEVQQELAIQSLSIANQARANILELFR